MEKLMQYVWQHRLWLQRDMHTVDGLPIQVIDPGQLNNDSGPDFFNAKIMIDGRLWAGNVEIHVKASDWHRHHHDGNPAYDSVVLHVVDTDDAVIRRSNGEVIPQTVMPCSADFHTYYRHLTSGAGNSLSCAAHIAAMEQIYITDWVSTLGFERLYEKADRIHELVQRLCGDYETACYITLARSLGFGINAEPMERLAQSLPLQFIGKHSDSLTAIEALLFGHASLLDNTTDPYAATLRREYEFLSKKFGLRRPELLWKMSKMRPANFPHRRIALLATMLYGGFRMLADILQIRTLGDATQLFTSRLTGYWSDHYHFGEATQRAVTDLSTSSLAGIIINAVIPLQIAYSESHGNKGLEASAIDLLQSLPAENNSIVRLMAEGGIKAHNAFESQALIQLRRAYCEPRKCLYCRIGHRMLAIGARRRTL